MRIRCLIVVIFIVVVLTGCGTPLMKAIKRNDMSAVRTLIESGVDINEKGTWSDTAASSDSTALHVAAAFGNPKMVSYLIEQGADVNAMSQCGWTPLHEAVWHKHIAVVKVLLEAGADTTLKENTGDSPLDFAREGSQIQFILQGVDAGQREAAKAASDEEEKRILSRELDALKRLQEIGDEEAIVVLVRNPSTRVRGPAAIALGKLGAKRYVPDIAKLLKDPKWIVQVEAIYALADLGAKQYIPEIAQRLLGDYRRCGEVGAAAKALGRLGAVEYLPQIIQHYREWPKCRFELVQALGYFGNKAYAADIAGQLKSENKDLVYRTAIALGQMGASDYAADIAKAMNNNALYECKVALGLGYLNAKQYSPQIDALLDNKYNFFRSDAIQTLGKLGATEYADKIAEYLTTRANSDSYAAIWALGLLKSKKHASRIASFLQSKENCSIFDFDRGWWEDRKVSELARQALVQMGLNPDTVKPMPNQKLQNLSPDEENISWTAEAQGVQVPMMHLSHYDIDDPIEIDKTNTYIVEARNEGTQNATNVILIYEVDEKMKIMTASGPTKHKTEGQSIVFEPVAEILPGDKVVYRVVCHAVTPGSTKNKAKIMFDQFDKSILEEEWTSIYK